MTLGPGLEDSCMKADVTQFNWFASQKTAKGIGRGKKEVWTGELERVKFASYWFSSVKEVHLFSRETEPEKSQRLGIWGPEEDEFGGVLLIITGK